MQHDFKNRDASLRAPAIPFNCKTSFHPAAWPGLLLVASFLLFSATAAQAGTLVGTVLDPSGRPVPQAHVTLLRSLVVLDQKQADSQGTFRFEGLADGKYQLDASAPGLASPQGEVEIREAAVQTLDLHLQLSALQQQVVVSASLGDALASEVGSSVSVVSGQDIKDRAALNVLDVLSGIPGVEVSQAGRYGGVTGVYVRGGQSNYNLVMVDGIELNEFGGSFDFAPLPADGVDRVEVTRGPESALYGPNAVTSVINIVTTQGEGSPHFTVQAEGGSFTTRRFLGNGSGVTGGFAWGFDLSRMNSGGLVQNDNFRNQTAFLSLGYHLSPRRRLDFHFIGNANDAGAPGAYGSDPDQLYNAPIYPGGPTNYQLGLLTRDKQNLFGWEGSYSEQITSKFQQVTTGNVSTNDYYFSSPLGDSYSNNLLGVLNTRSEVAVSNKDFFVAGFEYNREQVKNTYISDTNGVPFVLPRTSLAFFAENRWSPTRRLYLTTGFRVDDLRTQSLPADDYVDRPLLPPSTVAKFNPRVAAAYMLRESHSGVWDGTRLHASFGTGIRPPDGFELAGTNNPHLKPETSISFDAGLEQRFFQGKAVLDATYFNNHFKDQIVTVGSLTNLSSFTSDNLGNSRAQGGEVSFRVHPIRSLSMSVEYTLDATKVLSLNGSSVALAPLQVGQQLLLQPRTSGGYNLTWRHGNLMLNTNTYIRGSALDVEPNDGLFACDLGLPCLFPDKGYVRMDGGFSYRLPKGVEIYGRLDNMLDQKYEEVLGYPSLPFNFLAGVRFGFPMR
jgi:outer membrane receptor protein involved in Fe transport